MITDSMWKPVSKDKCLARLALNAVLEAQPQCSLEVVSLETNPEYEAVSYVGVIPRRLVLFDCKAWSGL
jgi:hypothetical protein